MREQVIKIKEVSAESRRVSVHLDPSVAGVVPKYRNSDYMTTPRPGGIRGVHINSRSPPFSMLGEGLRVETGERVSRTHTDRQIEEVTVLEPKNSL